MTQITYVSNRETHTTDFTVKWGRGEAWWSGDYFLARVIVEICRKLRDCKTGYPAKLLSDQYFDMDVDTEKAKRCDEEASQKWNEILDKIIWAFGETYAEHENFELDFDWRYYNDPEYKAKIDEGRQLFIEYFDNLWD